MHGAFSNAPAYFEEECVRDWHRRFLYAQSSHTLPSLPNPRAGEGGARPSSFGSSLLACFSVWGDAMAICLSFAFHAWKLSDEHATLVPCFA